MTPKLRPPRLPLPVHHAVCHASRHAAHYEHGGFVAVAAADVAGAGHDTLWLLALWLLVTGAVALLGDWLPPPPSSLEGITP